MTEESADLAQLIDESDEIIGDVFRATEDIDPRSRHLLYAPLLKRSGLDCLGLDSAAIAAQMAAQIGTNRWVALEQRIQALHGILDRFKSTYTVASYWSPIDLRRRSIVHRPSLSPDDHKRVLANAFAFYALTFAGAAKPTPDELFSVIHYTSLRAPQKHGIITCFLDHVSATQASTCLHIPSPLHGLLDDLGISERIDTLLVHSNDLNTEDLEAALHRLLLNADTPIGQSQLDRFGAETIKVFQQKLPGLAPGLRTLIEERENVLRVFFGDKEIDFTRSAFMIATQLLWRRTCPSELMYAFPTYVNKTCCVFTMGVADQLSTLDMLAASSVARSLFLHPLLLDYSVNEARAEAVRRNNVFRRFLGHNLPKIIISPVTCELENIKIALADNEPDVQSAVKAADRLELLFEHYENLLIAFMPSERREGFFTGTVESFEFGEEVLPRVRVAFELMRSRILSCDLRQKLQLNPRIPSPCLMNGHPTFLTEILFNLVSNAVDAISPLKVKEDGSRAVIDLTVDLPAQDDLKRFAIIRVRDRGEGFPPGQFAKFQAVVDTLSVASHGGFWGSVDELLEPGLDSAAREEHMGMGIVLCAAYLRSLEWQPDINAAGRLELISAEGEGSTISIFLPMGGEDHV